MGKVFNYTGTCIPGKHYMVDISSKISEIMKLVEDGHYFTINKPRQYGKSTVIFLLEKRLPESGCPVISLDFQGTGDSIFKDEQSFAPAFVQMMADRVERENRELYEFLVSEKEKITTLGDLSRLITKLSKRLENKAVLIIDEVDASSNNGLFLRFLGMLREKYLLRNKGQDDSFKSVILAGVHDVKSLKLKLRPGEQAQYNSPWNIAIDFRVDLSFSPQDIATMLNDYAADKQIDMDIKAVSERIHYYTSGYPFLVSKLCYIMDKEVMTQARQWKPDFVEEAVRRILLEDNTNFQSLTKNLENNPALYDLIKRLTLDNDKVPLLKTDPVISLAITCGILKDHVPGICEIHNRIYSQLIFDYMMMGEYLRNPLRKESNYNFRSNFIKPDNSLDFELVLLKFQLFMKEQYSEKDTPFLERNGRLVFLSFLKPIINGQGYDFKEVQVSEEKRLDVVVTFNTFRYIVELKIWDGEEKHQRGLKQLGDYLERQNCTTGYLVVFDFTKGKEYRQERIVVDGKGVFAVWV